MGNNIKHFLLGMLIAAGPVTSWVNSNIASAKGSVLSAQISTTSAIDMYDHVGQTSIYVQAETVESTPTATPVPIKPTSTPLQVQMVAVQETAPKPTVQPIQLTAPADIDSMINKYATEYGADPNMMKKIAKCESGYNPEAISPSGAYHGMYQFVASTWVSNREAMGLDPNPDLRRNAEEAIRTAAFKMGRDGYGAWPVCSQS